MGEGENLFIQTALIMEDEYEEDCGGDFAYPVYLNNGYTLDYTTISSSYRRDDEHRPLITPEPSAFLLLVLGVLCVLFVRNKSKV